MIDPLAVARLRSRLADHGDDVSAVVAPTGALPPGSSYRSHAERCALAPDGVAHVAQEPIAGATLVRAGVGHRLEDHSVTVESGHVLVDPGCHVHDPSSTVSPSEPAVPDGRSPFPRRPLVLFLALEPDMGRAVWARNIVNALLDHETEARLALVSVPDGPHLTRPCAASAQSVRALQPDVVITLDDAAAAIVDDWCDRRSTAVVQHTGERTLATALVSWRIGAASGRVRALIGSAVDAPTLAQLCSRLCSMPPPIPPDPMLDDAVVVQPPRAISSPVRRSVAVVRGVETDATGRLDAFLTEAKALGADTTPVDAAAFEAGVAETLQQHDVVLLAGDVDERLGVELARERAAKGRTTILDVAGLGVSDDLLDACGAATAPTEAVKAELERHGVPTRLLPILLTRAELNELRRARVARRDDDPLVIGVSIDVGDEAQLRALTGAVDTLLADDPSLAVEWCSTDELLPDALANDPRVQHRPPGLRADACAHWSALAWVGSRDHAAASGRPRLLIQASYLGIPTVFDAGCHGDVTDDVIGHWALAASDREEEWAAGLRAALAVRSDDRDSLEFRAELRFGRSANRALVNRLLGWAASRPRRA